MHKLPYIPETILDHSDKRGHASVPRKGIVCIPTVYHKDPEVNHILSQLPKATRANSRPFRLRVPPSLAYSYRQFINNERGHIFTGWNFRKCLRTRQFVPIPYPDPQEKPTVRMSLRLLPEEWKAFKEFCKAWKVPMWQGFWLLVATPLTVFDRPVAQISLTQGDGQSPTMALIPTPSKREAVLMAIRAILPKRGERFSEGEFRRETVLLSRMLEETGYDLSKVVFAYKEAIRGHPERDARFVYKHRQKLFEKADKIRAELVAKEERERKVYDRPCIIVTTVGSDGNGSEPIGHPMSYTTTNKKGEDKSKVPDGTLLRSKADFPVEANGFSGANGRSLRIVRYLIALRRKPIDRRLWKFSLKVAERLLERVGNDDELAMAVIKLACYLYPDADFRFIAKHLETLIATAFVAKRRRDELRSSRRAQAAYYTASFPRRALPLPKERRKRKSEFAEKALEVLREVTQWVDERTKVWEKLKASEFIKRKKETISRLKEQLGQEVAEAVYDPLLTLCPVHRNFVKFCPEDCYHAEKVKEGRVRDHCRQFPEGYFDLCEGCGRFKRKCVCGTGESWVEKVLKPIVRPDLISRQDGDEFALCEGCGQFVRNCKCTKPLREWRERLLRERDAQRDGRGRVYGDEFAMCANCRKFLKFCQCEMPTVVASSIDNLQRQLRKLAERETAKESEPLDRQGLYEDTGVAYLDRVYFGSEKEGKKFYCPQCGREMAKGAGDVVACLWCRKEFVDLFGILVEVDGDGR
jgi:hypothetical protein